MANSTKTKSSPKPETPKSASKRMKHAPLSNGAIRFAGFIVAFVGIMLVITKDQAFSMTLKIGSIFAILWGVFMVSGNAKKLDSESVDKNKCYLNMFIGFVLIIIGIILLVFQGQISSWFIIIIGALIGVYGLMMLIKFICSATTKKTTFNIIMSVLTLVIGILICLLYIPQVKSAGSGVCFYVFGSIAAAVGVTKIICY